jgi:hypothetical protein
VADKPSEQSVTGNAHHQGVPKKPNWKTDPSSMAKMPIRKRKLPEGKQSMHAGQSQQRNRAQTSTLGSVTATLPEKRRGNKILPEVSPEKTPDPPSPLSLPPGKPKPHDIAAGEIISREQN